jgi:glutamate 5-kinase
MERRQRLLFGEFLVQRSVVTEEQVLKALNEQKKNRLPIGTVAVMEKFLTYKDVYEILNKQVAEPEKNFGELALELELLNLEELEKIVGLQKEKNPHVGEILIEYGFIDRERLQNELNAFVRVQEADQTERFNRSQ